jgi:membrane-associated phospholipid phosphatase
MSGRSEPFLGWPGWKHLYYAAGLSAVGTAWFLLVYGGADALNARRPFRIPVHFDWELAIPFIPETVLIYMSIYLLFLAAPFVLRRRQEFLALSVTLNTIILVAGICFVLVPAEPAFAPPKSLGAFPALFRFADWLNLTTNLVPSLHVALSVGCVAAFATRARTIGKLLLWTWGAATAASTLLTHQHHVVDVVAGFALAGAAFKFIYVPLATRPVERSAPAIVPAIGAGNSTSAELSPDPRGSVATRY